MKEAPPKQCNVCGELKPLGEFYRSNKSPDGHGYTCKSCSRIRARQWAKEHPDRHLETMRRYMRTEKYKATRKALLGSKAPYLYEQQRDYYFRNKDTINARIREKRATDPEYRDRQRERSRQYRQRNRQRRLKWQIKALYGLGWDDFQALIAAQLGCCAICGEQADLVVDHDHGSDPTAPRVRGLLCDRCNHGLGHFRDNPEYLAAAIEYLRR